MSDITMCSWCGGTLVVPTPAQPLFTADELIDDATFEKLSELRNEYRLKMNRSADAAQAAAQTEEMDLVSLHSTESERYREAFHALNRAIEIVDAKP